MLFSSPDYPLFLIAVFVLYAVSRFGGAVGRVGRIVLMVWLGDLVFVLVAKDPDLVWDPIGNVLLRASAGYDAWPLETLAWHWAVGLVVLGGALAVGIRGGASLARRTPACSTSSAPASRSTASCSFWRSSASRSAPHRSTRIARSVAC
jgi:hypothetical protein